ncbi:hypothetical protein K443DRAFT_638215, partial [Laccaria amethystina LaAM-08-1]
THHTQLFLALPTPKSPRFNHIDPLGLQSTISGHRTTERPYIAPLPHAGALPFSLLSDSRPLPPLLVPLN